MWDQIEWPSFKEKKIGPGKNEGVSELGYVGKNTEGKKKGMMSETVQNVKVLECRNRGDIATGRKNREKK